MIKLGMSPTTILSEANSLAAAFHFALGFTASALDQCTYSN